MGCREFRHSECLQAPIVGRYHDGVHISLGGCLVQCRNLPVTGHCKFWMPLVTADIAFRFPVANKDEVLMREVVGQFQGDSLIAVILKDFITLHDAV